MLWHAEQVGAQELERHVGTTRVLRPEIGGFLKVDSKQWPYGTCFLIMEVLTKEGTYLVVN